MGEGCKGSFSHSVRNLEFTEYDYLTKVVNDQQINAYNFPRGNVVIFTALLELKPL